jgi:hypothetical protein
MIESMGHILTCCSAHPVQTIWNLARQHWPHEDIPWPNISLGLILGCGVITPPPNDQENQEDDPQQRRRRTSGPLRLLQILISESAHLIWVLRCDRVIQGKAHTIQEITARWFRQINARLTDDKIIATKIKRTKGSIRITKDTWEPLLNTTMELPNDWLNCREVLVGRRPRPPSRGPQA